MSKLVLYGKESRDKILAGVDLLANVVKVTEGPRGRNVVLGQRAIGQSPKVTRDGVTVSNYVDPKDPTMQLGSDLVREAAQKTDNAMGDGTTASIVLAQAMIHAGYDLIERQSANPMAMDRGIRKAVQVITDQLQLAAQEANGARILQVATVSAHGDTEIGNLVATAIEKAGREGIVTAEPSTTSETRVEVVAGLELEKANLLHPAFMTNLEEMKAELIDCRILLWEGVLSSAKSLVPILKQALEASAPLLIVAGGFEAEALAVIIKVRAEKGLPLAAVRIEHYGDRRREVLRDLAALTGGKAFTEDMGTKVDSVLLADLGTARKVVVDMSKTQIIDGRGKQDELVGRLNMIRQTIETAQPGEKSVLKRRLAALQGGITVIKVGGVTVTEMEEKRDRVIDALGAAKAAIAGGVVAGGGMALLRASEALIVKRKAVPKDEQTGFDVVNFACRSIVRQIVENAGLASHDILPFLETTPNVGFNAMNGEFENLFETGILDPVRVITESLKNAAAVAGSILTLGATVAEVPDGKAN